MLLALPARTSLRKRTDELPAARRSTSACHAIDIGKPRSVPARSPQAEGTASRDDLRLLAVSLAWPRRCRPARWRAARPAGHRTGRPRGPPPRRRHPCMSSARRRTTRRPMRAGSTGSRGAAARGARVLRAVRRGGQGVVVGGLAFVVRIRSGPPPERCTAARRMDWRARSCPARLDQVSHSGGRPAALARGVSRRSVVRGAGVWPPTRRAGAGLLRRGSRVRRCRR